MKYDKDRGFLRQIFVVTGVETSGALSVYFSSDSKSHVRMLGASYITIILLTVSLYDEKIYLFLTYKVGQLRIPSKIKNLVD